jgi:hypothetical protein
MLDGLVEGQDGEVIEAKDAPKNLFSVPGTTVELDGIQRAQRWYEIIQYISAQPLLTYKQALRTDCSLQQADMPFSRCCVSYARVTSPLITFDIGSSLEIYLRDTRNLLVVFGSKQDRQIIHNRLASVQSTLGMNDSLTPSMLRTPLLSKVSARLFNGFRDEISTAQRRWQAREISNVTVLIILIFHIHLT